MQLVQLVPPDFAVTPATQDCKVPPVQLVLKAQSATQAILEQRVLPAKQDILVRTVLKVILVQKEILEILVLTGLPAKRGLAATLATLVLKEQPVQLELGGKQVQRAIKVPKVTPDYKV